MIASTNSPPTRPGRDARRVRPTRGVLWRCCSKRRTLTKPVVGTCPPSTLMTRVIGTKIRLARAHLDDQTDDPGPGPLGAEGDDDVTDPTSSSRRAGRTRSNWAGASDEDARCRCHGPRVSTSRKGRVGPHRVPRRDWPPSPVPGAPARRRGASGGDPTGTGSRGIRPGCSVGRPWG